MSKITMILLWALSFVGSFLLGLSVDKGIDINALLTAALVFITLITSLLALNEMKKENGAEIILYTEIDEGSGNITLFVENIGGRCARELSFEVKGSTMFNPINELPFFKKTHPSFSPREKYQFLVGQYNSRRLKDQKSTCEIVARYTDPYTRGKKSAETRIDHSNYDGIKVLPK